METLTITFEPGKPMQVAVNGVQGPSCTDLTKFLEEIGQVEEQQLTDEFYQLEGDVLVNSTNTLNLGG